MDGTLRKNIKPGLRVRIVEKMHQQTGQLTEGVVRDVLTKSHIHHRGIKVRLVNGLVGRVQEILSTQNKTNFQGGQQMSQFENVTITKAANVYFDGKVTSRTVLFSDGSKKTLGIMMPGEYRFNTAEAEIMEIMAGSLEVLLPNTTAWATIKAGESFEIPANSEFGVKVTELVDYCCSYA